jgi:hypothetical protein
MSWLSRLGTKLRRRGDPVPLRAEHNAHGITQATDSSIVHIAWEDITDIIAYKKDCFTVDQIRLEISSKEQNIVCTEDDQDLTELTSAIAIYLPDIKPDWYSVVASAPAFEATFTRVYPADR